MIYACFSIVGKQYSISTSHMGLKIINSIFFVEHDKELSCAVCGMAQGSEFSINTVNQRIVALVRLYWQSSRLFWG